jgi:hypothetical protein
MTSALLGEQRTLGGGWWGVGLGLLLGLFVCLHDHGMAGLIMKRIFILHNFYCAVLFLAYSP